MVPLTQNNTDTNTNS